MKKTLLAVFGIIILVSSQAQDVYELDSSHVRFFSTAPLEDIEAVNHSNKSRLRTSDNTLAIIITIKGFKFDNSTMQDHFNENYLESDKYPYAQFNGKIDQEIDYTKNGSQETTATGKLTMHGVEKEVELKGTLEIKDHPTNKGEKQILINCKFIVSIADYKIKIPKAVIQNIAEKVEVTSFFQYKLKKK